MECLYGYTTLALCVLGLTGGVRNADAATHYSLPMDLISGTTIINPSGLDATAMGQPSLVPGVHGNAIKLNTPDQYIRVSGPGHRSECFGDLDKCPSGYTLAFWVKFDHPVDGEEIVLSNGGHSETSYGVAMVYDKGTLQFRFRRKNGEEWRVSSDNVLPGRWYHVAATWGQHEGLSLYIDGVFVESDLKPEVRGTVSSEQKFNNFVLGRSNDQTTETRSRTRRDTKTGMAMDEFHFWSTRKTGQQLREMGPIFKYYFPMEVTRGDELPDSKTPARLYGNPSLIRGKVGRALRLDGRMEYVDGGEVGDGCLGDLQLCTYGLSASFWINSFHVKENMYYLDSGSKGFRVYYKNKKFIAEFQQGNKNWKVEWGDFERNKWYFIEVSWNPEDGARMYVNLNQVAHTLNYQMAHPGGGTSKFYIGRANTLMVDEAYAQAYIDEVEIYYADRARLLLLGLINRGEIAHVNVPYEIPHDNVIIDKNFRILVYNGAHLVPAKVGKGVSMDGNLEYTTMGEHRKDCFGNLEHCNHGLTMKFQVFPRQLRDNMYIMSSGPYQLYYRNGRLYATFSTSGKTWTCSTATFRANQWQEVELTWHEQRGLQLYINGREMASDVSPQTHEAKTFDDWMVYLGRPNKMIKDGVNADMIFDEMDIWYAHKDFIGLWPKLLMTTTPIPTTTTLEPENYIIFGGSNWILYDNKGLSTDQLQKNNYEQFMIEFKASDPNGLLWWAGTEDRNIHLSLKNGQLVLYADYGGGKFDQFRASSPSRHSLDDGEWHTAIITRRGKNIVISLDGLEVDQVLQQEPNIITPGAILVGGYQDAGAITNNVVRKNLEGYVKQMQIQADHIPQTLDLFDLYNEQPRQFWVIPNGLLPENARSRPESVTFTKKGAYIRLGQWDAEHEGVLSFRFRTTEPDGLVLYNEPAPNVKDFVSVEMYDGVMHFLIDTGDGVHRYPFSDNIVNDGHPHQAKIERSRRKLVLTMDGEKKRYRIPGSNTDPLDLGNRFYIGAVENNARLPWHLWTRQEKYFLGCLWDLEFNNARPVDLAAQVRDHPMNGLQVGCVEKLGMCVHNPCAHGQCIDMWTGTYCDCAGTVYTGDRCQDFANVVTFDGTDYLRIKMHPMMETHTNDISLRFKTKKTNGLLFSTANKIGDDYIRALIENGHGKLRTNLGGREQVIEFGRDLADNEWHTLYIKRRANDLWVWVDDQNQVKAGLPGKDYTLNVDRIDVAAMGASADEAGSFAGWMQNFFFNRKDLFYLVEHPPPGWEIDGTDPPIGPTGKPIPEWPVTLTHPMDSYATLDTLEIGEDTEVSFMFKTKEPNGLLLYNAGSASEFLAVELVDGYVLLVLDDGTGAQIFKATSARLNDERWHYVKIRRVGFSFSIVVDETSASFSGRTKRQGDELDLSGALYIGGMPRHLYNRLPVAVQSRHGFRGCLASIRIGSRLINLMKDALSVTSYIKQNCTSTGKFCFPGACHNRGICLDGFDTFICDCNMTAFVGRICTDEPEGYRFGKDHLPGVYVYNYDKEWDSRKDSLALGFMTWYENGTIARIESKQSADYIEAKMKDGFVLVEYNIGGGKRYVMENRAKFNDGQYHVLVFERSGENATLRVDNFPIHRLNPAGTHLRMFDAVSTIMVGGNINRHGKFYDIFRGIVAGLYFNGLRGIDSGIIYHSIYGVSNGDVTVAPHPFHLPKPSKPDDLKPPDGEGPDTGGTVVYPDEVPPNQGGGVIWKESYNGEGIAVMVQPGGVGAGAGNVGAVVAGGQVGGVGGAAGGAGGAAEGGRAAAVAGALLGSLLLASSLIWALYKFKPGLIPFGGGGGAGGGGMKISSPRATTNYSLVSSGSGAGGAGAGGAGAAGSGLKMEVANGSASGTGIMMASSGTQTLDRGGGAGGGGAGGSQMQSFNEYFSSMSQSTAATSGVGAGGMAAGAGGMAAGAGGMAGAGAGSYGTMTRAIQTDRAADTAGSAGYGMSDQQQFQNFQESTNSYSALDSYQASSYMQNTLQTDQSGAWQMQHMALTGAPNLATLAAEEIRVDCLLMTSDGHNVVTGSIYGPPQAWDLSSGELVRIMSGEELSSTDLHLACNDTLLVGQVAEMTQIDPSDPQATNRIHHRKLQIWDFLTGRPLEMDKNELCTASCMMSDGERIVLGRTEKFGGGTTVVIYDLLANEPVRKLRYDAAVGFADYISYLNLSKDNRYVIAGFQNSFDGNANFIIFDLTADSYSTAVEPKLLALDACAECTAVLDNHEAVTGTRSGELLIWSMRTGKPLRQLVSPTGSTTMTRMGISKSVAHGGEVKAVSVSRDGKLLVSGAADGAVKVWNLDSERLLTTLKGHNDEVWCCTISVDNDIIVSGSKDGTIRLWRLATASPICIYQTGVDVFSVRMSNNKRTIVALGDKFGARKLIMLRVVVTKTRSRAPSRATSPFQTGSRPTSPLRAATPIMR